MTTEVAENQSNVKQNVSGADEHAGAPRASKVTNIRSTEMSDEMQQQAEDLAHVAISEFKKEYKMAEHISVTFTLQHGGTWHAIVGRHFGSSVSPEASCFTYFDIAYKNETWSVLLWRAWSPAARVSTCGNPAGCGLM